jgi:hypothetical protein
VNLVSNDCDDDDDNTSECESYSMMAQNTILASLPCNVQTDLPALFHDVLPNYLEQSDRKIDTIIHSLQYSYGNAYYPAFTHAPCKPLHLSLIIIRRLV